MQSQIAPLPLACHPELPTAFSGKGGQKRRVRDSANIKPRHPSASLRRTPERSASARKRRCAQSKGACAPFVSGSVLRLRAAGTARAKLISAAALRSGCFRRWKKCLVSEQQPAHRTAPRPCVPGVRSISTVAGRTLTCRARDPSPGHSARVCPSSRARLRVTHRRACSGRPFPRRRSVTQGDIPQFCANRRNLWIDSNLGGRTGVGG